MKHLLRNVFLLFNLLALPLLATADEIKIVALGASQTNGKGVSNSDAYPAQLERILKAEDYAVSVANEGVDGATTRDMLSRLSRAVPDGTKIVILQPGTNDNVRTNKRGSLNPDETRNNVEQMLARFKEKYQRDLIRIPGRRRSRSCAKILSRLVWSTKQRLISRHDSS
jgi:lysophospholipase L1-like esterase